MDSAVVPPRPIVDADFSRWPLVVVRVEGQVSDDAHAAFIAELDERVKRHRVPYALVMDLRKSAGLTPTQRKRQSDRVERLRSEGLRCAGVALVFESAVLRGMLTAIMWLSRPAHEVQVFRDVGSAIAWARRKLD